MLIRRIKRRKWLMVVLIVFIVGCIVFTNVDFMISCSDDNVKDSLHALCELHKNSEVDGALCQDICNGNVQFIKCLYIQGGKTVVLAFLNGEKIIIKASKASINDYDPVSYISDGQVSFPSPEMFRVMVFDSVRFNFLPNITQSDPMLDRIAKEHGGFQKTASMRSAWSLLQQDEYVFMEIHKDKRVIPEILGTCGHFYAVEYAPPKLGLDNQGFNSLFHTNVPYVTRAKVAFQLLEAVKLLETEFTEIIHVCDTKGENFGISKGGAVKVIDTDMVFSHSHLMREFGSENCIKHSQCDFFDCRGLCNFQTGKCVQQRTNNNLQVVCKKIFLSKMTSGFSQLLQDPPHLVKTTLESLLTKCATEVELPQSSANTNSIPNNIFRSDLKLLQEITDTLLYSIKIKKVQLTWK